MTLNTKIYHIAGLFADDLSVVATALKLCQIKDDHKTVLRNLTNQDLERYSCSIGIIYEISTDHYLIDGLYAIVDAIHTHTTHGFDSVKSNIDTGIVIGDDCVKGARLCLFNDEEM